jgi:hypothetical protein
MPILHRLLLPSLFASLSLAPSLAQAPAPAAPQPALLDPAQTAAKSAFERLEEAERKAIQADLIWTGDFNGVAGGEFGKRTYDAMLAFENRSKGVIDGILDINERALLKREAQAARQAVRYSLVTDERTGIRIGLPAALLPGKVAVQTGTVYRSVDAMTSLELVQFKDQAVPLAELFERFRQDGPGRKVSYKLLRPDWFVVSGEEGGRRFYTRIATGAQGLRGYSFRYPPQEAKSLDRIMIALANSFEPFPTGPVASAPTASQSTSQPAQTPSVQPSAPARPAPGIRLAGILVAPGKVLTSASGLQACINPRIGGQPVEPNSQKAGGLALANAPGAAGKPTALLSSTTRWGGEGQAFALSFGETEQSKLLASGQGLPALNASDKPRIQAALQNGAAGAPVFDAQGQMIGLIEETPKGLKRFAGTVPAASYAVIDLAGAQELLRPQRADTAFPGAVMARIMTHANAMVAIACD